MNPRFTLRTASLVALALTAAFAVAPARAVDDPVEIERFIPANAAISVIVRDLPDLRKKWETSPFAKTMKDPQVRAYFGPLFEDEDPDNPTGFIAAMDKKWKTETGKSFSEISELFEGSIAMVFGDWESFAGGDDDVEWEVNEDGDIVQVIPEDAPLREPSQWMLIIDIGDNAAEVKDLNQRELEARDEGLAEGLEEKERIEQEGDIDLHIRSITDGQKSSDGEASAIVGRYYVLSGSVEMLRETVRRMTAGGDEKSLSRSANYQSAQQRAGKTDAMIYLDIESLVSTALAEAEADAEAARAADPDAAAEEEQLGLSPRKLVAALGADKLRGAYVALTIGERYTDLDLAISYSERVGLMQVLAFTPGPVATPDMVPADAVSASVTNFSFNTMWSEAWKMGTAMNPAIAAMAGQQLNQANIELGINIENDLIKPLGGHMVNATFFRAPEKPGDEPSIDRTDDLWMIELTDRARFEKALGAIMTKVADGGELVTERKYLETTIYTLKQPIPGEDGEEKTISYAFTDKYVLLGLGSASPIEQVLVNQKQGIPSIWQKPEVKDALGSLPPNPAGVGYVNVHALAGGMIQSFNKIAEQFGGGELDGVVDTSVDLDSKTLGQHFGAGVTGAYVDDTHMRQVMRVFHAE